MDSEKEEKKATHRVGLRSSWSEVPSKAREIISTLAIIVAGILLAVVLTRFVFQSYQVEGQSMETSLQNGDRLIVNKIPRTIARISGNSYVPARGDIVIFNQSGLKFGSESEKQLIKRVVGLPGERVVVKDGKLTVHSSQYPGGYEPDKTSQYSITSPVTPGEVDITLHDNEIFVCGDNRSNSEDSRYFGALKVDNVVGKLAMRVIPINKAHRF